MISHRFNHHSVTVSERLAGVTLKYFSLLKYRRPTPARFLGGQLLAGYLQGCHDVADI